VQVPCVNPCLHGPPTCQTPTGTPILLLALFLVMVCRACALQDQVGLSLVHLLGDTETLAQTQAPQPVTLQELCDQNKVSASVRWVAAAISSSCIHEHAHFGAVVTGSKCLGTSKVAG
jgi:hypothetical protein